MATLRNLRSARLFQALACVVVFAMAWLQVGPVWGDVIQQGRTNRLNMLRRAEAERRADGLPQGITQTPGPALRTKIAAKKTALEASKPVADVRSLSAGEMGRTLGRGPLRNPYFAGAPMPWQKSFHDVNMCTGNLFKSFTDIQIAPARGAGLVLQRTYNSNDARVGPFGVGWTHAYDIRIQEAADAQAQSGAPDPTLTPALINVYTAVATGVNQVPRTDFFGTKHSYHRDADGLYSPPPYMYDEVSSNYGKFLINGPPQVMDDTEKGMDGTIKHYTNIVTKADGTSGSERACDYIQDRYGNKTVLTYGQFYTQTDGSTRKLLTQVADPTGRSLTFQWTNFGTASAPAYRITETDTPTDPNTGTYSYRVTYAYYGASDANAGGAAYQLKSVTLDSGGLSRTTTYTYTSLTVTYTAQNGSSQTATETGYLASITDPLGHTVSYQYVSGIGNTPTVTSLSAFPHVSQISEPASGVPQTWYFSWMFTGDMHCFVGNSPFDSSGGSTPAPDGIVQVVTVTSDNIYRATSIAPNRAFGQGIGWVDNYDANNNVFRRFNLYVFHAYVNPDIEDNFSYGQHGNVLTHWNSGFSSSTPTDPVGKDVTTYCNASQYFQKQSVQDTNGRLTSMGIGTNTAGNTGDSDPNIGDRGQVLWVQDAGYNDSASPSYHKQFTYTYNQYGQKVSETNLSGIVTQYTYGTSGTDLGNLVQVVQDPGGTGHLNRTTSMHYDVMGRVLSSTDPAGQVSTFTYNTLGQPKTVATPAKGATPAEVISYTYGGNGRTHSVTDNRGTTTITYEDEHYGSSTGYGDRVYSVSDPDPLIGTITYTYFVCGARKTMSLPSGRTWTYAYQNNSFVDVPKDDPESMTPWLSQITDDQGRTVEYSRTVNEPVGPQTSPDTTYQLRQVKSNESFDSQGNLVSYLRTSYYTDDTLTSVGASYPSHGWTQEISTTWNYKDASGTSRSRVLSQNDYTYDNVGNRLTNTVSSQGVDSNGNPVADSNGKPVLTSRTEKYTYDALYRLSTVDYGDGETQSYGFDPMGNRLSKTDTAGGATTSTAYGYDAANRLLSTTGAGASTYANDADGNTLTGGGRTNTWDSQNRMVSCAFNGTTNAFAYGADGLRRSTTVTPSGGSAVTTRCVYDGSMLVQEQRGPGAFATYLNGTRGPECRVDETKPGVETGYTSSKTTFQRSPTKWYVYDGLGSVVGEMDPSGNLTSSPKYDVYGLVRANPGTASSAMGFVGGLGHLSEVGTGLIYMKARYYDPALGRFASEDPKCNGLNWFVYCSDNPVNKVDATGEAGEAWLEAAAKLIWNAYAAANNIDLGFDPTDDLVSNLEKLRSVIDASRAKANADIVAGTIEANSPEVLADDSGVIATDGSQRAKRGLVEKATGAVTKEQIDLIEAWVDYVK